MRRLAFLLLLLASAAFPAPPRNAQEETKVEESVRQKALDWLKKLAEKSGE